MNTSKLIKLRIPGERFWARPLSDNTAEIMNILTDPEYGLNDIVAHDGENVTCVLVKKTETAAISYVADLSEGREVILERVNKIIKHFQTDNNIQVEPTILCRMLIAYPVGVQKEVVMDVVESCPVPVQIRFPDTQEDDDY
jgi:Holliday junction resolvase-like predicted endonuclease